MPQVNAPAGIAAANKAVFIKNSDLLMVLLLSFILSAISLFGIIFSFDQLKKRKTSSIKINSTESNFEQYVINSPERINVRSFTPSISGLTKLYAHKPTSISVVNPQNTHFTFSCVWLLLFWSTTFIACQTYQSISNKTHVRFGITINLLAVIP